MKYCCHKHPFLQIFFFIIYNLVAGKSCSSNNNYNYISSRKKRGVDLLVACLAMKNGVNGFDGWFEFGGGSFQFCGSYTCMYVSYKYMYFF